MSTRCGGGRAVRWFSLLWHLAAVGGAVGLMLFSARADQTPGTVQGTVRDAATGAPIPCCLVMIDYALDQPRSVSTDAQGRYRATELPPGLHIVQAGCTPPYDDARAESLRLGPGTVAVRSFRLDRNPCHPALALTANGGRCAGARR